MKRRLIKQSRVSKKQCEQNKDKAVNVFYIHKIYILLNLICLKFVRNQRQF